MTVGFYSPLPPARTGVADYAAALAQHLSAHCHLRFNRDGDMNLYHVGNNQLHVDIYRRALERPGVVILHDAVLHHFMLGSLSRDAYIEEFMFNYGPWTQSRAEQLWQDRGRSAVDPTYFRYAFLKRIAETSIAVIVHNPAAARIVREHFAEARVLEVPHLLIPHNSPHPAESERLRNTLGTGLVCGVFGHLRESKRILPLLRVFARCLEWKLVLVGDIASRDLGRACEPFLTVPNIIRLSGFLKPRDYWVAANAVDACVNLRYPAAGETSGVSVGMMGCGIPVVMSDSEENSRYPSGTCVKIAPGLREEAEMEAVLAWAAEKRSILREIGLAGQEYAHAVHDGAKIAATLARSLTAALNPVN